MRKKINPSDKREHIIGVKVKKEIKDQIQFISQREARPMSTQINIILEQYIASYFNENDIKWSEYADLTEGGDNS